MTALYGTIYTPQLRYISLGFIPIGYLSVLMNVFFFIIAADLEAYVRAYLF